MTIFSFLLVSTSALLLAACTPVEEVPDSNRAVFNWFEYEGKDAVFDAPLAEGQFQNPILAGFYPDPSITRAGDDFYLVTSSFSFYPGVPIFHSTDLVNWRQLGHVLTRPEQLELHGAGVSRGIFAPTIRYHDGTFYMITTLIDTGGNFLVMAENPSGPWSDPVWLPEIQGIDPDIFFDDDGRVYIAHNGEPEGEPLYDGHRAIWLWEYNPETQSVIKDSGRVIVNGGVDISQHPVWIEAPHIFKKDGWYYLSCAEGGTAINHSQVIFRTRSLEEAFIPYENNPILTQRDLAADRPNPITTTGHADMIQTPAGEWWAVFLGVRTYDQTLFNTGRETFLLPVTWKDEWPHILPPGEQVPYRLTKPANLPATSNADVLTGNFIWRDSFDGDELSPRWNLLRTGDKIWYSFTEEPGAMSLTPLPVSLSDFAQPALLAHRQQHTKFEAATELELPLGESYSAGLTVFQNETYHYYFSVTRTGENHRLSLERARDSQPEIIESRVLDANADKLVLGTEGDAGNISFYYRVDSGERHYLTRKLDARMLSTEVAGGFVGTYIGIHARQEETVK